MGFEGFAWEKMPDSDRDVIPAVVPRPRRLWPRPRPFFIVGTSDKAPYIRFLSIRFCPKTYLLLKNAGSFAFRPKRATRELIPQIESLQLVCSIDLASAVGFNIPGRTDPLEAEN